VLTPIKITTVVEDQYSKGLLNTNVYYTDSDSDEYGGYLTINPSYTDPFFNTGVTLTYYRAGVSAKTVTITATVIYGA
jgi:hypothetical protein